MKGIIFNVFEVVVTDELGEDGWEDLLERADVDGAYTSLGNYPDEELIALLRATPGLEEHGAADLMRWFGRRAIPVLALRYPVFFAEHRTCRDFLLTLNDIIHPEVRKAYPGADVPVFDFDPPPELALEENQLAIGYRSARRLCALAEGFILGAGDHYGERVDIDHPRCMHDGHERCTLVCTFVDVRAAV
jgi:hypothetical protein